MYDFLKDDVIRNDMENIYNAGHYLSLQNKTVLITGAYGMLASYMVYFLLYLNEIYNYGVKIISLSRNEDKFIYRFGIYADKIVRINKSVNEHVDVDCNYIIHAASFASPQYYEAYPIDVILPNVLGTYHMLELACANHAKLLYLSTCSVYGKFDGIKNMVSENDFGTIDPLDLHSCYDESKRTGEMLCAAYFRQKNVPVVIARIAHTYGPTMDIENDPRVFASFVKNAVNKEDIEIKSDGLSRRSFCYISDATTAYFKLLFYGEPGEAYNVCNSEQTVSIRELGEIISGIAGVGFKYKKRDESEIYLQDENADTAVFLSGKLQKLGFSFEVDVKKGFSRVLSHFVAYR